MSKYKTIISVSSVQEGTIVQYPTKGTFAEKRNSPFSYGYVHKIEYDSQHGDQVLSMIVLPIVPLLEAKAGDFRFHSLSHEAAHNSLGLNINEKWAAILAPVNILNNANDLGNRDHTIQRMGEIAGTEAFYELRREIDHFGSDDNPHYLPGAPRMRKASESTWGLYVPLGITRNNEEDETRIYKERKIPRKRAEHEGKALDIDLDVAVEKFGLNQGIAELFTSPVHENIPPLTSLRAAWEVVKNPDTLDQYLATSTQSTDISLEDLKDTEIHIAVVNGLAEPRKGSSVAPITDLESAYKLVTERPQELSQYNYLGKVFQQKAIEDITAAYQARDIGDVSKSIKDTWSKVTDAYLKSKTGEEIPEQFLGDNSEPVWKFVVAPR